MTKSVFLKVSSAFLVGGQIAKTGEIVEVTEAEAKDLLQRGKATLATANDAPEKTADEVEQESEEQQQTDDEAEQAAADEQAETKPAGKGKGKGK